MPTCVQLSLIPQHTVVSWQVTTFRPNGSEPKERWGLGAEGEVWARSQRRGGGDLAQPRLELGYIYSGEALTIDGIWVDFLMDSGPIRI